MAVLVDSAALTGRRCVGAAAVLGLLAAVFAVLRWSECTESIAAQNVRFASLHALAWDPASGQLEPTGPDPFGILDLPTNFRRLQSLTFEFSGAPAPEAWFSVYQYPYYLPGEAVDERWTASGSVEPAGEGFVVRWRLAEAKFIRLDLPDALPSPLVLRRIVLSTAFVDTDRLKFVAAAFAAAASVALLAGATVARLSVRRPWVEAIVALGLAALHVSIARDVPLQFCGTALHDDALFVTQARAIIDGQWLGSFNELTLSKGPVYSAFLALVGSTGVPLKTAQAALYALGCLVFVWSLRPLMPRPSVRLLLLAALLLQPNVFSGAAVGRVLRTGLQPALVLLTLAAAIGILCAAGRSRRALIGWAVAGGIAGALFWYSREEGVWLVPSLLVVLSAAALRLVRSRCLPLLAVLVIPFAIVASFTWGLRLQNKRAYHAPIAVDVKDGSFPRAYGALLRITPRVFTPGVPVPRETRLRIYEISPTFAQLRSDLEGRVGEAWSRYGWENTTPPATGFDMRGGWFQWALRQAAALKGHYRDARAAELYWRAVDREINWAADEGRIAGDGRRSGFFPRWDASLWPPFAQALGVGWRRAAYVDDFVRELGPSTGTPDQQQLFANLTHESGLAGATRPTWRTHVRVLSARAFALGGGLLTLLATAASLYLAITALRCRSGVAESTVVIALAGGAGALVVVVALVHVTSFSALFGIYLAPATPLIVAWWILSCTWALGAVKHHFVRVKPRPAAA